MDTIRTFLLGLHIAAGTCAVAAGLFALLSPKGDSAHRRAGSLFARCMAVILVSAVGMTAIKFNPYFLGLAASALVAVFSGVRVLGRKRPDLDPTQRARGLDWAVVVAVGVVALILIAMAATGKISANVPVVYALAAGCLVYAAYDAWRFVRPTAFPFSPQLWLYEHLVKMLGAYFGAVAAFSGSVLVFLDPPWRQLWATSLGQALTIGFIVHYVRRGRRPRAAPDDVERAMADAA